MSYLQHARRHLPGGTDPIPGIGGNLPWCRVRMWGNETNQTIPTATETQMHFNDSQSDDPDSVFTGMAAGDLFDGIQVNADGLYLIKARMYWASGAGPPAAAVIMLNGVDTDRFAPYLGAQLEGDTLTTGCVSTFARLPATQGLTVTRVAVTVRHEKGSDAELYGNGGNFLEMVRIGSATTDASDGGP